MPMSFPFRVPCAIASIAPCRRHRAGRIARHATLHVYQYWHQVLVLVAHLLANPRLPIPTYRHLCQYWHGCQRRKPLNRQGKSPMCLGMVPVLAQGGLWCRRGRGRVLSDLFDQAVHYRHHVCVHVAFHPVLYPLFPPIRQAPRNGFAAGRWGARIRRWG